MPEVLTLEKAAHPAPSPSWKIVSLSKPILWARTEEEVWMLNPERRYILNADQLGHLAPHIATMSELVGSRHYHPLVDGAAVPETKILVYRYADRGVGDHLFMTGPLNYLRHVSGGTCKIDMYGLTDRHQVLAHHPTLQHEAVLAGPVHYDDLQYYHWHWFVETATEYSEEFDQLNVYDALYRTMGVDPGKVDVSFKRPTICLVDRDYKNLDQLYYVVYNGSRVDLRLTPYYVVAPFCHASLRSMPYSTWLLAIRELAKARPVVVLGRPGKGRVPDTDMPFGNFVGEVNRIKGVINLMSDFDLRTISALIARAVCMVSLDSGLLYVAEATRVPAVSIWGTHAPQTRLAYDKAYLDWAIWPRGACANAPCFAYAMFPKAKCPRAERQTICECLMAVKASDIVEKVTAAEKAR
jgi:ADP-heptose:LPS heptosyltransferase